MKTTNTIIGLALSLIVGCSKAPTPTEKVVGVWSLLHGKTGVATDMIFEFLPEGDFTNKPTPTSDTFKGKWIVKPVGNEIELTLNEGTPNEGKYLVVFEGADKMEFLNPKDKSRSMAFTRKKP